VISLQYRETDYNTELSGSFSSDDAFFNQLWQKSQRTLYITMRDNFMDCPDRERAQWWGDATNEMNMMMYALDTNSYSLYKKGINTLIGWTKSDKVLPSVVPSHNFSNELPMQMLAGINGFWQYYLYTGKKDQLLKVYYSAKEYLSLWSIGANGLVTVVKQIAEVLGKTEDIQGYDIKLSSIKVAFNSFWTNTGYRSSQVSVPDDRANAIAVLSNLADKNKYPIIRNVMVTIKNSSPYMEKYVLDSLCQMGSMREAQDRIKDRYADTQIW